MRPVIRLFKFLGMGDFIIYWIGKHYGPVRMWYYRHTKGMWLWGILYYLHDEYNRDDLFTPPKEGNK